MSSEEGEIFEPSVSSALQSTTTPDSYDPSYEWPGSSLEVSSPYPEPLSSSQPLTKKFRPNQPSFRLIILRTSILSPKRRLAVIDGYSEVQFGRDVPPAGSTTPRLRLKEMEVSKLHATAYWDASRREWGIVDMGSMHGTFLQPASAPGDDRGVRLSPARQASIPRKLNHLDRLTIGSTTFLIHMHEDQLPCEECWTGGGDEILLLPNAKASKPATPERSEDVTPRDVGPLAASYTPKPQRDPKKALTMLKHSLLTRHIDPTTRSQSTPPADNPPTQYVDRSARRRALGPTSGAPGTSLPQPWVDSHQPPPPPRPEFPNPELVTSKPPTPLPTSNIGHRLLMKQGWEPGTALGSQLDADDGRIGLVEPLEVAATVNRGGLGLKRSSTSSLPSLTDHNWKESAKRRRWGTFGFGNG